MVTDVIVTGPPGSATVTQGDADARGVYGRREAAISFFSDFEDAAISEGQLQAHADRALIDRTTPVIIPQVRLVANHQSIPWGSYWLGDTVTVRARIGNYHSFSSPFRIIQIDVELDENDNESITLGLNAV
jgi:hypothetical protein